VDTPPLKGLPQLLVIVCLCFRLFDHWESSGFCGESDPKVRGEKHDHGGD
jgi:hypothetical protein